MADTPGRDLYAPLPTSSPMASFGSDDGLVPADRGTRFFAKLIDNVALVLGPVLLGCFLGAMSDSDDRLVDEPWFLVLLCVPMLLVVAYQAMIISNDGQSIGKRVLGIRIVNERGEPPGFWTGVIVRGGTALFLSVFCRGVGSLVDALCIFREDRRCLHDLAAGTRVVRA